MRREKVGNYFIDWSDFREAVSGYIDSIYNKYDQGLGYVLIPQARIIEFIMNEYGCSWTMAKEKLTVLVMSRRDLSFVKNLRPRKGPFSEPYITKYISYRK